RTRAGTLLENAPLPAKAPVWSRLDEIFREVVFRMSVIEAQAQVQSTSLRRAGRQPPRRRVDRRPDIRNGDVVERVVGVHADRNLPPRFGDAEGAAEAGVERRLKQAGNGVPSRVAVLPRERKRECGQVKIRAAAAIDWQTA